MSGRLFDLHPAALACWHEESTCLFLSRDPDRMVLEKNSVAGHLTTGPVDVAYGFHRLVLSWNIFQPEGTSCSVECRVQTVDGSWTPWLAPTGSSSPKLPEGVEFRIDEIRLVRAAYRFQVRVGLGRNHKECASPEIARICVSTRRVPRNGTLIPRDKPMPTRILEAPFLNQDEQDPSIGHRICSPTCIAMVLQSRGSNASAADVARLAYDPAHDMYGIWPLSIHAAFQCGAPGYVEYIRTWAQARTRLRRGSPIVASIAFAGEELENPPYAGTEGHLVLLLGIDPDGSPVTHDPRLPADRGSYLRWKASDFTQAWFGHGGVGYVFDPVDDRGRLLDTR